MRNINDMLRSLPWGALSLVSLYISLVSGVVVALQYEPTAALHSTIALSSLAPFGTIFRSLHFYSSQIFFLLIVVHFWAVLPATNSYSSPSYIRVVLAIPVALLLLFTGYILRGDMTGNSAGMIAEEIFLSLPMIGKAANSLLFSIGDHGMQRVYVHHVITLDLLWLALAWEHLRKYRISTAKYLWGVLILLCFCTLVAAPLDPEKFGKRFIAGPWFFLGLQELLRYFHPIVAGILFPAILMVTLLMLQPGNRYRKLAGSAAVGWLVLYAICTGITLYR